MNKIALITDTHFGVKNDSKHMLDYFNLFLDDVFFPSLLKNNIKTVLNLGDIFDRRKFVNFNTLRWTRKMFFDRLQECGIEFITICGNHDVYYKNTNEVNSLDLLIASYPNVTVHTTPTHLTIGNTKFLLLPWMNDENRESSLKTVAESDADVLIAHMGIVGFEMVKGVTCSDGYDMKIFNKFKKVLSGHFHLKATMGNITYLGSPWELNFSDCNISKGFYFMDTQTADLEFIQNPQQLFRKFDYNDKRGTKKELFMSAALMPENVEHRHIKLLVKHKKHPKWFDGFIDRLYACDPLSLNVIDLYQSNESDEPIEDVDLTLDTLEILNNSLEDYKDNLFDPSHIQRITEVMGSLYIEAQDRD